MAKLLAYFCCRNCSLKSGTLFIGIVSMMSAMTAFFLSFLAAAPILVLNPGATAEPEVVNKINQLKALFMTIILYSGLLVFHNILLIVGTAMDNIKMIFVYILFGLICIPIRIIFMVVSGVLLSAEGNDPALLSRIWLPLDILFLFVFIYFLWVVYSHYQMLKERQKASPKSQSNQPYDYQYAITNGN